MLLHFQNCSLLLIGLLISARNFFVRSSSSIILFCLASWISCWKSKICLCVIFMFSDFFTPFQFELIFVPFLSSTLFKIIFNFGRHEAHWAQKVLQITFVSLAIFDIWRNFYNPWLNLSKGVCYHTLPQTFSDPFTTRICAYILVLPKFCSCVLSHLQTFVHVAYFQRVCLFELNIYGIECYPRLYLLHFYTS